MIPIREFNDRNLAMATQMGTIKKVILRAFGRPKRGGIIAITLDVGEKLIGVKLTNGDQELILGSKMGKSIRFSETEVRSMGRAARGVRGIRLKKNDEVIDLVVVDTNSTLLTVCENGHGKRTSFDEYRLQTRGGQGVINIKVNERNGNVIGMKVVRDDDELMMMTSGGKVIRTPVNQTRVIGRNTQGVKLISLGEGDKLVSVALVLASDIPADEEEPDGSDITGLDVTGSDSGDSNVDDSAANDSGISDPTVYDLDASDSDVDDSDTNSD